LSTLVHRTRFFPAVEHARVLLKNGSIGKATTLHSDFTDPCYDFQYAPFVFGAENKPTAVVATGAATPAAPRAAIAQ
jgi:predicted dehydrogenase